MEPLIKLEDVTKDFGAFRALDHVSLNVDAGITGLLGPNGAGKSTLIKILLGLLRTSGGGGHFMGFELGRQSREIRERVGYMPEDDCFLFGLTGVESVHLSAQLSRLPGAEGLRRAHEILDFCGIAQERYRTVETYSSGMRQKLRFAQAIVHDPPVLILDEPTSGLDPEEREAMLRRIQRLARDHGKTILLCTHILPDVQSISDAVVILARGRVRVADRLEELSRPAEPSLRVRLLGSTAEFLERWRGRGLQADLQAQNVVVVRGDPLQLTGEVWATARACGVGVRSLTPSRNSLEQIFLSAVREGTDGDA
jgi:ABC-2 type transport system ATP-binding protein